METVHLTAHTNAGAEVTLRLPESMKDRDVEVMVVAKVPNPRDGVPLDALGFPLGSKERFFGAFPDAPEKLRPRPRACL